MSLKLIEGISGFGRVIDLGSVLPVPKFLFEAFSDEPEGLSDLFFGRLPVVFHVGVPLAFVGGIDEKAGSLFFESNRVSFVVEGTKESFEGRDLLSGHDFSLPRRQRSGIEAPKEVVFFRTFWFVVDDVFFYGPRKVGACIEGGEDIDEVVVFIKPKPVGGHV